MGQDFIGTVGYSERSGCHGRSISLRQMSHPNMTQSYAANAVPRHTVSWCSLSPSCELSKSEMPVAPSAIFWKKMLSYWMQDVKTYKSRNHVFSCSVTPLKRSVLINQPVRGEVRFMSVTWHRVYCAAPTHAPSKNEERGLPLKELISRESNTTDKCIS